MLLAGATFAITFLFSVFLARNAPWQWAFFQSIAFPQIDPTSIQRHVIRRTTGRIWLVVTLIASALVAGSMVVAEPINFVPMFAGIILIVAFASVQGFRLFKSAVVELGIDWPPPPLDN